MKRLSHFCIALAAVVAAATGTGSAIAATTTVARWDFGTEETSPLVPHGDIHRDQPGPRPPEFPDFGDTNTSVKFDGRGSRFSFADRGAKSEFDFTNGDEITLEAWVRVGSIGEGENVYVIGKGRTGDKGFAADNQNWALRLRKVKGTVRISFLFATPKESEPAKSDGHWHRWTSDGGLQGLNHWHSVAVTYKFGDPSSVRGWIDGKPQSGTWDMGGATSQSPVVDDDAVWIGSSMGGSASASFRGWIDSVAIHRGLMDDQSAGRRFQRADPLPEMPPQVQAVPGRVKVTFQEAIESHQQWPVLYQMPSPSQQQTSQTGPPDWLTGEFFVPRLPYRYDDWGIRSSWKGPVLVQAIAEVSFPAGKSRLMVRARGLSRLWVDDKVIVRTAPIGGSTDGHQPVDPLPEPPLPGMRIVAYGLREQIGELDLTQPQRLRVVFETLVGGEAFRAEPGEMMVGVQLPGSAMFELLQPADSVESPVAITDDDLLRELSEVQRQLTEFDDAVRRAASSSQTKYWNDRHELARQWASSHPAPAVPDVVTLGTSPVGEHPIDRFIGERIAKAAGGRPAAAASPSPFQAEVLPILKKHCFRCHGDKDAEAGLQLTSREAMLAGGDSGEPVLVPRDPHASAILARVRSDDEGERMPPSAKLSDDEIEILTRWVSAGAEWSTSVAADALAVAPIIDDAAFLRRAFLDTVGEPPTESDVREFLADTDKSKRVRWIDRLLEDPRWADHWVSYWQDVLAENPNMLKPALNNTGPFRWFLYEALRDNRPLDRMVTELVMMRGSEREGGSAGFGMAADNDAPLATRGMVLASAFLGTQLQCARCHDSPYHSTKQKDLFSIAAMMSRGDITVPPTSTVSAGFFEKHAGRQSLTKVTLKPGEPVPPQWPFPDLIDDQFPLDQLVLDADDSRERLAASITAPANSRFAGVMVNRLWKRLIGAGIVEPADDWETGVASHPELLAWLSNELIANQYDAKHVVRLIMNSNLYQRQSIGENREAQADNRFFAAPDRRRLSAEQVVDSLVAASGKPIDVEELSFDPEAKRPAKTMISLGYPSRAWMFATLSNERDRPSLAFPRATAVVDLLEAFGWTGSRQSVINERDIQPNVLQPGTIANGVFASWMTAASADSDLAELAIRADDVPSLVKSIYLRFLSRLPSEQETSEIEAVLSDGFDTRVRSPGEVIPVVKPPMLGRVSWSNHLAEEANSIKIEMEKRAVQGDAPDPRLRSDWRMKFEDVVWALVNSPEFVWIP
ncbi:MAG: DUF1553 domain-containing protein [Planctomycetaceae bacterium]